jgi:hypothetical protein
MWRKYWMLDRVHGITRATPDTRDLIDRTWNLGISSSGTLDIFIIAHWEVSPPVLAVNLVFFPFTFVGSTSAAGA